MHHSTTRKLLLRILKSDANLLVFLHGPASREDVQAWHVEATHFKVVNLVFFEDSVLQLFLHAVLSIV